MNVSGQVLIAINIILLSSILYVVAQNGQNSVDDYEEIDENESYLDRAKRWACKKMCEECCLSPFVRKKKAIEILRQSLKQKFFGQHLALDLTLNSLEGHLNNPKPRRPLVLSFHGWAGSGKTYLAMLIIEALFQKGENSIYYKFFSASHDFPELSTSNFKLGEYKDEIRKEIEFRVRMCQHSVFIFDEVDKAPPGVFDVLSPFIDYPARIDGLSFRKSIFIFMSNAGSNDITNIAYKAWQDGRNRQKLTFHDFESLIQKDAFNKKDTGLYKSSLIDRVLVDYFVPFLPMEKKHVKQCIIYELQRQGWDPDIDIDEIANTLEYWPNDTKRFSSTGCKRVEARVRLAKNKLRSRFEPEPDDDEDNRDEL